jgi:hypothetical protein
LLHGRLGESVSIHPLGPPTAAAAALFAFGVDKRSPIVALGLRSRPLLGAAAAAWIAVWLVRLRTTRP